MPEDKKNPAQEERRALRQALHDQQKVINAMAERLIAWEPIVASVRPLTTMTSSLSSGLRTLADLAGARPQVVAAMKTADAENPAQPIPAGPSGSGPTTTEEARKPDATDSLENKGEAPATSTAPDATTSVDSRSTDLQPTLNLNQVDVTSVDPSVQSPPSGDAAHAPVDVRAGTPANNETPMYPWTLSKRIFASLNLAQLRIEAGIEGGNPTVLAQRISEDKSISDQQIDTELRTLSAVKTAATKRVQGGGEEPVQRTANRRLVPQPGQSRTGSREAPSLRSGPSLQGPPSGFRTTASAEDPDAEFLFDMGPSATE